MQFIRSAVMMAGKRRMSWRPSCCGQTWKNEPKLLVDVVRAKHSYKSKWKSPKTPELIYVPHLWRWLRTKFRFKYLQKAWDPDFTEGSFIYGSTRAVCRITEIIHANSPDDLKGLVTSALRLKLSEEMKTRLTKFQKQIIHLNPEDIKILVPLKVEFTAEGVRKRCVILLRVLALKWFEDPRSNLKLVLVALQVEFGRDYTVGAEPEWIISTFDILECAMLSETPSLR